MPSWPTCVRMDEPQVGKLPCVLRYLLKVATRSTAVRMDTCCW